MYVCIPSYSHYKAELFT